VKPEQSVYESCLIKHLLRHVNIQFKTEFTFKGCQSWNNGG